MTSSGDDATMAPGMRIPVDLQPILRDYTKAVLREKPEDERLKDKNEQVEAAIGFCREHESALGRLFEAALLYRSEPRTEITRRLERHGAETVVSLETYMTALASVVGVAPMIGFLGTIIGLVEAFMSWETLGDQITVGVLAGGIYKAMLTTAAGLSVAIPYYLLYNHLTTRVQGLARLTESRTEEFLDALTESSS